ncbi:MAG: HNH endonuclease [Sedimentisphaerales bacterium]|nr:HNH endonuclease [Sedimentisphaerales bacterium]
MNKKMRKFIPKSCEVEVLFLNRHTCCICHDKGKDVQIHHIDGDNSNNDISNLSILCLDCHSRVTGTRGLGKSYSSLELKLYKKEWENIIKKEHGFHYIQKTKRVPKIERQLFVYEAKALIYRMLSAKDSNKTFFETGFENLWQLAILEGIQTEIIEHLGFAFALSAISEVNKPVALAKSLPKFFGYLGNPIGVPLRKSDERDILEAIDTLEFVHDLSVEENKSYRILSAIKNALSDFIVIAINYHNYRLYLKARRVLYELFKSSTTKYDKHDKRLPKLAKELDGLKKDIRKELKRENLSWKI